MARKHNHFKTAEEQELADRRLAAGLLSEKYPHVSAITIGITYYRGTAGSIVMVRTINIFPSTDAYFHMHCIMKECSNGGFDLTPKIHDIVKNKKKYGSGKMACRGSLTGDHACISYEINVKYNKNS